MFCLYNLGNLMRSIVVFKFIKFHNSIFLIISIITRMFAINIARLTELLSNFPLSDLQLPAVKKYKFQYKGFVGLMWLTSYHMLGSGDSCDKSPSWFLKILKLPKFYSGNFKIFKMHSAIYPKSPSQTCGY